MPTTVIIRDEGLKGVVVPLPHEAPPSLLDYTTGGGTREYVNTGVFDYLGRTIFEPAPKPVAKAAAPRKAVAKKAPAKKAPAKKVAAKKAAKKAAKPATFSG